MDATATVTILTRLITDTGDTLAVLLPIVFSMIGVLIGLHFAIRFILRHIERWENQQ